MARMRQDLHVHIPSTSSTFASLELPKFAEMLLKNDVAFIAP